MPGNPLGRGTVNVQVNWLLEEKAHLGRLAMQEDLSLGSLIRKLVYERLSQTHPATAKELVQLRKMRRGVALGILPKGDTQ